MPLSREILPPEVIAGDRQEANRRKASLVVAPREDDALELVERHVDANRARLASLGVDNELVRAGERMKAGAGEISSSEIVVAIPAGIERTGPARRSAAGHVHIGVGRNGEVLDLNRFRNQLFHQKVREFWPDMVVVLDSQTAPGPSGNCWFQRPRRRHNDDKWRG